MIIYSNLFTISQELLQELFEYCDGQLYWKVSPSEKIKKNSIVGTINSRGYSVMKINYKSYRTHRIIFMYHHGYIPKIVDHIDGNTSNNTIQNLRDVTQSQNQHNRKINSNNTSGIKGVYWHKTRKRWTAGCSKFGKWYNFGPFKTKEEAEKVVKEFRETQHGEYANHG